MKSNGSNETATETKESENFEKTYSDDTKSITTNRSLIPITSHTGAHRNAVEESDDSAGQEKFHKRDSGFHTMTRHPYTGEANESLSSSSTTVNGDVLLKNGSGSSNDNLNSMIETNLSTDYRDRSSPVITKKSFKFPPKPFEEDANDLALKLFNLEGKDKRDVAKHLTNKGDFSLNVAKKYMELFNFTNVNLDEAMRLLLKRLALLGETQERERVLHHFAFRYNQCNPSFLDGDLDAIHILVCAIALLNTDLHGAKVGGRRRMTRKEFITNLAGVTKEGHDIPTPLLKDVYRSISKNPLPWCEQTCDKPSTSIAKSPSISSQNKSKKSQMVLRSQSMNQPSLHKIRPLPVYPDNDGRKVGGCRASKFKTIPKKQGVLWRKPIVESDGTKTPKRKRRWKLVMVALQGLEFHIAKKNSHDSVKVSLHHCVAEVESSHSATKRDNVIRVELANRSVTLYQTSSREEQKMWARAINRNAALLSAAPLSAGVGSQAKFQRPLLPSASSTLPLVKQLEEQQNRLDDLCNELDELQNKPDEDVSKAAEKQYRKDKTDYLLHEIHKYEVYTNSLSELVTAERQLTKQQEDFAASLNRRSMDAQSLLSVSPSEPGIGQNLSSYPSTEDTGSVGDLLEHEKPKQLRLRAVTSPLSPTTSLPNLQPQAEHLHAEFSAMRRGLKKDKLSSRPDYSSRNSLPAVDESEPMGTTTPTHPESMGTTSPTHPESMGVTSPTHPEPNENNCNNKHMDHRHGLANNRVTKQSSFVGTSYLSKDVIRREAVKQISRDVKSSTSVQSPPRVKGRKERKGASRYSYVHAVFDAAQI